MNLTRALTRPMLAAIFVSGGIDTFLNPGPPSEVAGDVALDVADALPVDLPPDPEALVKIDAAAKIAGGVLLATGGRLARIGAVICAVSLVPTTFGAHRFWETDDPAERSQQRIHFLKNVSILGGLLTAALDTGGRPSLPWRVGHVVQEHRPG